MKDKKIQGKEKNDLQLKNKKKQKLKEKGITLIALVVTIIILLILAGVTLNMALSGDGLFSRARNATDKYKKAQEDEEEKILKSTKTMYEISGIKADEVAKSPKYYYGKKVNYMTNEKEVEWKIYYSDGNNIFLISSDYLPTEKITDEIKNKTGLEVEGKYRVFWSTTPAKQEYLVGKNGEDLKKSFKKSEILSTDTKEGTYKLITLLNTDNWIYFVDNDYADYAIGGSTLEMFCNSWNSKGYGKLYCKYDENRDRIGFDQAADKLGVWIDKNEKGLNDDLYFIKNKNDEILDKTVRGYFLSARKL